MYLHVAVCKKYLKTKIQEKKTKQLCKKSCMIVLGLSMNFAKIGNLRSAIILPKAPMP